jgi:CRISPR-associated protein Csb1
MKVGLQPEQGMRFQPTGFPDIGAAQYAAPCLRDDGVEWVEMLLVESAQSVANHLEQSCLNETKEGWVEELEGLPYICVKDAAGEALTNSIVEAHRINSEYIIEAKINENSFKKVLAVELKHSKRKPVDRPALIRTLFSRDPNSLLHGAFLEEIDGRYRVMRAVSGFVEALNARTAQSGGVKVNRIEPSLKGGKGNVVYQRTEFVASEISAFFNIDLALLRSYGRLLGTKDAAELLLALALLKIQRFLSSGLRLRTACHFAITEPLKATNVEDFSLPSESELLAGCRDLIQRCAEIGLFASPRVTEVIWSREVRNIIIALPEDAPEPIIPEDLELQITFKKKMPNKPATVEVSPDHGWGDVAELAEAMFPDHQQAREAAVAELSATRIEVQDDDIRPKIPKNLKAKIRWAKPKGNQAGEIWIAADIGMEAQELAEALFPSDDSGQNLVLKGLA